MTPDQLYELLLPLVGAIIGTVVVVGLALAVLILRWTARIDADTQAFQVEAAADRRAFQAGMTDFRAQTQNRGQRQSHVEGRCDATSTAGD